MSNDGITPIMLIGGMKCGTSSLYRWLEVNPKISTALKKEPEYFSENEGHGLTAENYLDLFDIKNETLYTLDGSTGYAKYPLETGVARKIFQYNSRSKIIYIVRNPFDRIVSHYGHLQSKTNRIPAITSKKFTSTSNYFQQLEQYSRFFPLKQILVLDFDQLKTEPSKILDGVYEFLEERDKIYPNTYEVRNKTSQKPSYRLRRLRKTFSGIIPFIPEKIKNIVKTKVSQQKKKSMLTAEERKYIKDQLHDDMIRFGKKYNFNVEKWGFHE